MSGISGVGAITGAQQLTPEQKAQVEKLAARDRDVRAHEAAHSAAAGAMAGQINYIYELGPDGKLYAVGGDVQITVPPAATPEEALALARQLLAAADAPVDPSGQDMSVAARATRMEADAQQQIETDRSKKELQAGSPQKHHFPRLDRMA